MAKGSNQKLKLIWLMKILLEKTDENHGMTMSEILRELETQNRPLVVLMLGAPYDATLIRNAQCVICAYEYTYQAAQELLSALETGEFNGHLPVTLPELNFKP